MLCCDECFAGDPNVVYRNQLNSWKLFLKNLPRISLRAGVDLV